MRIWQNFTNGLLAENPTFRLVLGMCPVLAVTTAAVNGLGMGLATTFVLVCSNILISMMRKIIPDSIRMPAYIVIIASFVTIVELVMEAFAPELYAVLGIFVPLIVVNCIILGRAEAFANKNGVLSSAADGVGMGLGFTWALILIGGIREILGSGRLVNNYQLFGLPHYSLQVMNGGYDPALIVLLAPGAFLTLGILLGIMNVLGRQKA